MSAEQIYRLLEREYLQVCAPYALKGHRLQEENATCAVDVEIHSDGETQHWRGIGKGPLEALVAGLPVAVEIMDYSEHAIGAGTNAKAAAYIELRVGGGRALNARGRARERHRRRGRAPQHGRPRRRTSGPE